MVIFQSLAKENLAIRSTYTNIEDGRIYKAVINHREQYSIWPADRKNAQGLRDEGFRGIKLEQHGFVRVHKSHLLNREFLKNCHIQKSQWLVLPNQQTLEIARRRRAKLKKTVATL